jgi:hypothetical protein
MAGSDSGFLKTVCKYLKAGFREVGGDNMGPCVRMVSDEHEGLAYRWCANWATYVVCQAWDIWFGNGAVHQPAFPRDRYRTGVCKELWDRANADGRLVTGTTAVSAGTLKPGMLFLLYRNGDHRTGGIVHTGMVTHGDGRYFLTVEGNSDDGDLRPGSFSYKVARRIRAVKSCDFVDLVS